MKKRGQTVLLNWIFLALGVILILIIYLFQTIDGYAYTLILWLASLFTLVAIISCLQLVKDSSLYTAVLLVEIALGVFCGWLLFEATFFSVA
ncbi:hypothetical protein HZA33_04620 [Candidatus Pacearchaeota archaeon]|nr:hypothetical protein [Candidatus Pacearchaeota archaeon]